MNPQQTWSSGRLEHPSDSWRNGGFLASLAFLLASCLIVWGLLGSEHISLLLEKLLGRQIHLQLPYDYQLVSAVSAALFILVTFILAFFKTQSLTSPNPAPGRRTSRNSGSGNESESPSLNNTSGINDDEELSYSGAEFWNVALDTYTQFYDVISSGNDTPGSCTNSDEDTRKPEDKVHTMRVCSYLEPWKQQGKRSAEDSHGIGDLNRLMIPGPVFSSNLDFEMPKTGDYEHLRPISTQNRSTQSDSLPKPASMSVGTTTVSPQLIDASVGSHRQFKVVRSCDTATSGPFMKKLRRAQRLLKEARVKFKTEREAKLVTWTSILKRYKDRVQTLMQSLDKKDILLSYTALNRALSENELKDMSTSVRGGHFWRVGIVVDLPNDMFEQIFLEERYVVHGIVMMSYLFQENPSHLFSARDRLLTQCKLNFALKEVVESKCEAGTCEVQTQSSAASS